MAVKNKTKETEVEVADFINSWVENPQKQAESYRLIELMSEWSGFVPKMWGPSIIGFGTYHYKYASGREGDVPLIAFSPRKAAFSFYVTLPTEEHKNLLKDLGKFRMAKGCMYVKKLDDINISTLEKICKTGINYMNENEGCAWR